jgi:hypothetical protein
MGASAMRKRVDRFRELVDGMSRESKLAGGRKLCLTRQAILTTPAMAVAAAFDTA